MLNLQQNIKLQQKLSPQQIQIIKLLEYPVVEFEERIREEMEANPALEEGRDESEMDENFEAVNEKATSNDELSDGYDDYAEDDDIPDYRLNIYNSSPVDNHDAVPFSGEKTFQEHLEDQLQELETDPKTMQLARYLIGNIDEDGYLRRETEAMVDDLAFQMGISVTDSEMENALKLVQTLEPIGIGARSLQECLSLQLHHKTPTKKIELAIKIIDDFFEKFTKRQYEQITIALEISEEELKQAISEIVKLNPKPGNAFAASAETLAQRITPDFLVENNNGILSVSLNNGDLPELHVSRSYKNMVKDFLSSKKNQTQAAKNALAFAKQKIDAAVWFIDAIKQRHTTLLKTMEAIVKFQYNYFLEGDDMRLKPMKLKDIAEITGYDISTISRVSNSKYVQTEFGIFPLKHFFSDSMPTEWGEEVSNKEIKQIVLELVENEDKNNPISDDDLTEYLLDKGYLIARRTVAKYREQLSIPTARARQKKF